MKVAVTGGSGFIGTHVVSLLVSLGHDVINLDVQAPSMAEHRQYWQATDILDAGAVGERLAGFQPSVLIHLAARTDTDGATLDDYAANTVGVANVLGAISSCSSVRRLVMVSTQYVFQEEDSPPNDLAYSPHTVYGESKVVTEQLTRAANLECCWTIVRPTNIWGPWHPRYPREFWRVLSKGLYVHPSQGKITRSYGYVRNVAGQIVSIIDADVRDVHGQVLYLGDEPVDLLDWVNGFSHGLTGRGVKIAPLTLLRALAAFGDVLKAVGVAFPLTTSRLKNMTSSNTVPMEKTFSILGRPRVSIEQGIAETVEWLREFHPQLVRAPRLPSR